MGRTTAWHGESLRDQLEEVYRRVAPDLLARNPGFPGLRPERDDDLSEEIIGTGHFEGLLARTYPWSVRLTADGFADVLATQSDHRLLAEQVGAGLLDALRELIAARGGEVVLPHVTRLTIARRRAA
ncbi:MAG: hypothetical protein ABR950_08455 [Candidatus Dormibacteria bacterium]|jgi:hypothetical protein